MKEWHRTVLLLLLLAATIILIVWVRAANNATIGA